MGENKFQSLIVYQLALDYIDQIYELVTVLPSLIRRNVSSEVSNH